IKGALEQVHLWEEKDKKVKKLSGVMKERISIAGALLNDPEILLLDEPTVGLDPNERMRFKNLLMKLSERKIIIFATHIVSDVEDIADQVVILHKGSVKLSESMEKVMERAENNVWECDLHDIEKIQKIMNTYPVSMMKRYKGGVHFRIISGEKPCEEAVRVAGSLEEIYMRITGRA
ncbi:MAG: ATP-binding cassette domain-containing protein, partial [Lachnospiraceae bacterium]|nr:ATP-binding cassette domain-containing protein [Lachnospiraceae bacterium]